MRQHGARQHAAREGGIGWHWHSTICNIVAVAEPGRRRPMRCSRESVIRSIRSGQRDVVARSLSSLSTSQQADTRQQPREQGRQTAGEHLAERRVIDLRHGARAYSLAPLPSKPGQPVADTLSLERPRDPLNKTAADYGVRVAATRSLP